MGQSESLPGSQTKNMGQLEALPDAQTKILGQSESLPDPQNIAQWEFKSNTDPFSPTEQPQWTAYKPYHNYLLEKAYFNKEKEVDLGDYLVSLQDMLQKRKNDTFRQRPVRRNTEYFQDEGKKLQQEDEIRGKRFFGAEAPKTFTSTFGSLSHYLSFFQNRGTDIKNFAKQFHKVETSKDLDQINQTIHPYLVDCLRTESKKVPKSKSKMFLSMQEKYEKDLLCLFQKPVTSIDQFYANILKAYTMEGFLYQNLNRYLRNEDWTQLHCLLPYVYCLCRAFFCTNLVPKPNNPQSQERLTLYRGAQFDEASLSLYDKNTIKNFSWNSMTSTSRQRHVAEDFMYRDIDPKKKVPVMFIIEAPENLEGNLKNAIWMDIKPFSAIPHEDEVVLPPGSVFEIMGIGRDPNKGVEVNLRLITNIDNLAHQGQILHGALQSEMANEGEFKLICLEGREFSQAVTHLKGNRLIEELEFCLCKFNDKVLLSLAETLKTISRLKKLTFISSSSTDQTHWSTVLKNLEKCAVETLEIDDNQSFLQQDQVDLISAGIMCLTSLKSLMIDLSYCNQFKDQGLKSLSSGGIKCLESLTSLSLDFRCCREITDEGLKSLSCGGIRHLTSLTSLSLDFACCFKITDKGLKSLSCDSIGHLRSLTSLSLDFSYSKGIKDEGLKSLASESIKHLTSLTTLNLTFLDCEVTDEGLKSLACDGIRHLISLTSLNLDLSFCKKIADEGLNSLSTEGIKNLSSLKSVILNFSHCHKITDEGVHNLSIIGIKNLKSLISLDLEFFECNKIEDHRFLEELLQSYQRVPISQKRSDSINRSPVFERKLFDETLEKDTKELTKYTKTFDSKEALQRFIKNPFESGTSQDLSNYDSIIFESDKFSEIEHILSLLVQEKNDFTLLTSLTLSFKGCCKISDEMFNRLNLEKIKHLKSLTSLTLDFKNFESITDEGLKSLACEGIRHLTSLTSLSLNFRFCSRIKDEGLKNLASEGIKHLTSLTTLNLSFANCEATDEGLNSLACDGIRNLKSLTSLRISFRSCGKITDKGVKNISWEGIKYLKSLTYLTISFNSCSNITDKGLNILVSEGIQHLHSLKYLDLDFYSCTKITNSALQNLEKILKYFGYLPSLKKRS